MSKILLRVGGLANLLFVVFNVAMVKPIDTALASLSPDIRATVSTLNIQVAFILLIFAYLAIFRWQDLLDTRLGKITAIAISLFWFLRGANQLLFFELTAADIPLFILCLVFGLLYLLPAIQEWKKVPSKSLPQAERQMEMVHKSQQQIGKTPWTSYAVVTWCLLFGGLHLYWALGGTVGFVEWSMPSNRMLALTRDPIYIAITWGVVITCVYGIILALAPFQTWARRIPRWFLLTPLWIACTMLLVRGIGNPIQSALILGGGMPFEPLAAHEVQAWNQWLLIDAAIYSPWFILGGLAFGATARSAHWRGDNTDKYDKAIDKKGINYVSN